jgi:hypothetical protein
MCNAYDRLEAEWASDAYREYEEAMRYEEAARYDRFDGYRDDACIGEWAAENEDLGCPECGYRSDCPECVAANEWLENERREREAASAAFDDDVPF